MKIISVRQHSWRMSFVTAGLLAMLCSCATYQPQPLEDRSPLVAAVLPNGFGHGYDIDLTDGLDLIETGIVAVLNNPDLKVQRARLQVAGAQALRLNKPWGNPGCCRQICTTASADCTNSSRLHFMD